jgi:integrase
MNVQIPVDRPPVRAGRPTVRWMLAFRSRVTPACQTLWSPDLRMPQRESCARRGFNKAWWKARIAAGCPGRIPHDFRRTAVRNLVRAGVPERVAMQLTGHKTRAVFERYNIVSPGDLRDAARRLDTYASSAAS